MTPARLVMTEPLAKPKCELARAEMPQAALLPLGGNSQELEKPERGLLKHLQLSLPPV